MGGLESCGEAFSPLAAAGHLDDDLARRLVQAAGFRNQVAQVYGNLDRERVYRAGERGPEDLRSFVAALEKLLG